MLRALSWCQKARQIRRSNFILFPLLPQSKLRKPKKIHLPLEPPAKSKKIGTGKSKALADAVVEEVDFLCGLVGSNEKEKN